MLSLHITIQTTISFNRNEKKKKKTQFCKTFHLINFKKIKLMNEGTCVLDSPNGQITSPRELNTANPYL